MKSIWIKYLYLLFVLVFTSVPISTSFETRVFPFTVSHYEIQIRVSLERHNETSEEYTAPGNVRISGESTTNFSTLLLHANRLEIEASSISVILLMEDSPPIFLNVTLLTNTTNEGQIEIKFEEEIGPGVKLELYMEYVGKMELFSNKTSGGGLILFAETNGTKAAAMIPHRVLFPDSKIWRPLFPFMNGKATFNITVIREENFISVFHGDLLSSAPDPNHKGFVMDQYLRTKRMDPELISVAVLPKTYSVVESTFKNKTMQIHARPDLLKLGDPSYALNIGVRLFNFYSSVFNESDEKPEKMTFILLPILQPHRHNIYTLLNWGELMGFEDATGEIAYLPETAWHSTMLLKVKDFGVFKWTPEFSYHNSMSVSRIGNLVAGHVVRQYLSGSIKKFDLFPGIVHYLKYLGLEYIYNESEFPSSIISHFVTEVMLRASFESTLESLNFENLSFKITRLTIRKGYDVLKMLEAVLTKEVILNWIKTYREKAEANDDFGSQENFYEILQQNVNGTEHHNLNISVIIKSLLNQKGYPVVTAEVVNNGTQILLSQECFRTSKHNETEEGSSRPRIWEIPLFVVSQDEPNLQRVIWLRNESMLVEHNASNWIIFNNEGVGLYRVLYGQQLFQGIVEQLRRNASVFSPLTRAKLMSDYNMFSENISNYTSLETFLSLTQYLGQETEYIVWSILAQSLGNLEELFPSLPHYQPIMAYFHERYDAALVQIGVFKNNSVGLEPPLHNDLRSHLLQRVCTRGPPSPLCSAYGKNIAAEWKADVNNSISLPEVGRQYLSLACAAVATGGEEMYEILESKYEALVDRNGTKKERQIILGTFACLQDPTLVENVVGRILDINSVLRKQEGDAIFLLGMLVKKLATVETRVAVWNLLKTNMHNILVFNSQWDKSVFFYVLNGSKYSKAELEDLLSIFTDNEELFGGAAKSSLPYLYPALNISEAVLDTTDTILKFVTRQSEQLELLGTK